MIMKRSRMGRAICRLRTRKRMNLRLRMSSMLRVIVTTMSGKTVMMMKTKIRLVKRPKKPRSQKHWLRWSKKGKWTMMTI